MVQIHTIHSCPPASYTRAIGEVAAEWGAFEFAVEKLIWVLLKIGPKEGRLVTTQMNIRPKLEILKGLIGRSGMDATLSKNLLVVVKRALTLSDARNRIIHGLWSTPQKIGGKPKKPRKMFLYWYRGSTATRIMPVTERISPQQIRAIASEIRGLHVFISIATRELLPQPEASPSKA